MKISEIKQSDVVDFCHLEDYSKDVLEAVMKAAKEYILDYTGISEDEVDKKEKFYLAYMVLCQDMIDNRSMYVDKNNVNKTVESILGMHCENLL